MGWIPRIVQLVHKVHCVWHANNIIKWGYLPLLHRSSRWGQITLKLTCVVYCMLFYCKWCMGVLWSAITGVCVNKLICIFYLLVRRWSSILDYKSIFTLNQALSTKNMNSIIIRINLCIKIQPFNCLFCLIFAEYIKETALCQATFRLTWRPPFSYSFLDVTASQLSLNYFDIF